MNVLTFREFAGIMMLGFTAGFTAGLFLGLWTWISLAGV